MECLNCNSKRLVYETASDSYICLDCKYKYPKQYFFISHSHLDIEKVRIIRNIIEETFFYEPILFFLKCLSDEEEIQSLIRREIYERIWFVYCKSKNAENSRYVREERAYIQQLIDSGKRINVLNVELDKFNIWDGECHEYIRSQIAYQIRKTKPFICCSQYDGRAASAIADVLSSNGYQVWQHREKLGFDSWAESVKSHIKDHGYKDGCIFMLISERSLKSKFIQSEINYALSQNAFILPVLCTDGTKSVENALWQEAVTLYPALADRQFIAFGTADPYKSANVLFEKFKEI